MNTSAHGETSTRQAAPGHPTSRDAGSASLDYIQGLRGIAALAVVLWHASRFISPYGTGLGFTLFGSGRASGVDLFFLVSGFIMVHTTREAGVAAFRAYTIKRLTRIWPTYVVLSTLYVLVSSGVASFLTPPNVTRWIETLTFVPLVNRYGPPVVDYPSLAVGWTLNYEMYFYLIFGISLLFGRLRWLAFFGWIVFSLVALPLSRGGFSFVTETNYGFETVYLNLVTSPIIWLFVAGVLIGLLHRSRARITSVFVARAALTVCTLLVVGQWATGFRSEHGLLQSGLSLIPFLVTLTLVRETIAIPVPAWTVFLGDVSFSLYLTHPLVQEQLPRFFPPAVSTDGGAAGAAMLLLTTAASVAVAWVSFRVLERGLSPALRNALERVGRPVRQAATVRTLS